MLYSLKSRSCNTLSQRTRKRLRSRWRKRLQRLRNRWKRSLRRTRIAPSLGALWYTSTISAILPASWAGSASPPCPSPSALGQFNLSWRRYNNNHISWLQCLSDNTSLFWIDKSVIQTYFLGGFLVNEGLFGPLGSPKTAILSDHPGSNKRAMAL